MKMRSLFLAVAVFAVADVLCPTLLLIGAVSCTAAAVERETLLPAMRSAWPPIREDIGLGIAGSAPSPELGMAQSAAADRFGAALDQGDRSALAAESWPELGGLARVGIQSRVRRGEIGPGVAGSFEERLSRFEAALQALLGDD